MKSIKYIAPLFVALAITGCSEGGLVDSLTTTTTETTTPGETNTTVRSVEFTPLYGQAIYFENSNAGYGIRTFDANGTVSSFTSYSGFSQESYMLHGNSLRIKKQTSEIAELTDVLTFSFDATTNFNDFQDLALTVSNESINEDGMAVGGSGGEATTWNKAIPVPEKFLNIEITFVNNTSGFTGTRLFGENGLVTGVLGEAKTPYIAGYFYNPQTREVTIRNGMKTFVLIIPSDDDLSALPLTTTVDASGEVSSSTSTWSLEGQVTERFSRANDMVTDSQTGLVWQDDVEAATVTRPWLLSENYNGDYNKCLTKMNVIF